MIDAKNLTLNSGSLLDTLMSKGNGTLDLNQLVNSELNPDGTGQKLDLNNLDPNAFMALLTEVLANVPTGAKSADAKKTDINELLKGEDTSDIDENSLFGALTKDMELTTEKPIKTADSTDPANMDANVAIAWINSDAFKQAIAALPPETQEQVDTALNETAAKTANPVINKVIADLNQKTSSELNSQPETTAGNTNPNIIDEKQLQDFNNSEGHIEKAPLILNTAAQDAAHEELDNFANVMNNANKSSPEQLTSVIPTHIEGSNGATNVTNQTAAPKALEIPVP